ncbi:MAG: bacteriohemerythrin [Alphaproteobacteria bacterium]
MPQFFEWSEGMSVGVPLLDSDHKTLIRIINRLHESLQAHAGNDVLSAIFDDLMAYIEYHFAREEKVMKACGFPGYETHSEEHADFTFRIHNARERYLGGSNPELTVELLDYLKRWLSYHILIQDMAYKPYATAARDVDDIARCVGPGLSGEDTDDW